MGASSILAGLLGLAIELVCGGLQQASETPAAATESQAAAAPAAAVEEKAATQTAPAQAEADSGKTDSSPAAAGKAPAKPRPDETPTLTQFLPLIFIAAMFYLILLRPQQREQKRRQETLNALKKNDRVVTTGGIIGTIADLSADNRFVTLKVDDSTRIRFLRSAIHGLLEDKSETPAT